MKKVKLIAGVRDTEIVSGGFTAPKGFKISDFPGGAIFTTVRPMMSAIVANTNSFRGGYLSKCIVRARKRQTERFIIAFDAAGLTEKYSTKPKERMKVFTKGSRIKEEETLILTLPYESEEKKAKILSGEDGFALSFSLGDDYPCVVGGFALGSIAEMDKPRCALLTTDVKIRKPLLESALKSAVRDSFLMLEGGNGPLDCFYAVSSCSAENAVLAEKDTEYEKFVKALRFVAEELARRIASSGGKKLLKITVKGATSKQAAKIVVRNAFARGGVANWNEKTFADGALEAIATTGLPLHKEYVSVCVVSSFGRLFVVDRGFPLPVSARMLEEHRNADDIEVVMNIGIGNFFASGWTYIREKI